MDPRKHLDDEIAMRGVVLKRSRHGCGRERKTRRVRMPRERRDDDDYGGEYDGEGDDQQGEVGLDQVEDEADLDAEERAAGRRGGDRNVYFQYDGGFAYGQRHGEDATTVT